MNVVTTNRVWGERGALLATVIVLVGTSASGCITGSLACDTGYSSEGVWSVQSVQHAHVGEDLRFSMILREPFSARRLNLGGLADYAAVFIQGQRLETDAGVNQGFEWRHQLRAAVPGQVIVVRAEAYRTRGVRDYMKIRGTWHNSVSAVDEQDGHAGSAQLKLRVYQSTIDYAIAKPTVEMDWLTARLVLTRRDGRTTTIFADKPHRRGFVLTGPDQQGRYRLRYEPSPADINRTATTHAALYALDVHGVQHTYSFEFDTP